jgi:hypothetical protein
MRLNQAAIVGAAVIFISSSVFAGDIANAAKAMTTMIAEKISSPQEANIAITFYALDEKNPTVGEKVTRDLERELKSKLLATKRYRSVQIAPSIKDPRSTEVLKRTNWFVTGTYLHRGNQSELNWKLVDPMQGGSTRIEDKQLIAYPNSAADLPVVHN